MSNISKRKRDGSRAKFKSMGEHTEFLKRITKTLYYGQLPSLACLSLPVTEISCELWSTAQRGRSLRRLHADAAARLARAACVSPCSLVLAILYLERLKACNPDYLASTSPSDLFLVSLMVSNKFLQDEGEEEGVVGAEWAASGGVDAGHLRRLEVDFLNAIDWNVFVSESAFNEGLSWLEREVALRQARGRGFFTYSDLAAACDRRLLRTCTAAAAAAAASAAAALAAVLASALLLLHAAAARDALAALLTPRTSPSAATTISFPPTLSTYDIPIPTENRSNSTLEQLELEEPHLLTCCTRWLRREEAAGEEQAPRRWYDSVAALPAPPAPRAAEPRARAPRRAWLFQASLLERAQRWLEKVSRLLLAAPPRAPAARCHPRSARCAPDGLNFSKLGAFVVSFSDR